CRTDHLRSARTRSHRQRSARERLARTRRAHQAARAHRSAARGLAVTLCGAPSRDSAWWQLPIAKRARAALTVETRGSVAPGRITIASTKPRMKIPTAHQNAVV